MLFRLQLGSEVCALTLSGQRIVPVALPRRCAAFPVTNGHDEPPSCANVPGERLLDTLACSQIIYISGRHIRQGNRGSARFWNTWLFWLWLSCGIHLENNISYPGFRPAIPPRAACSPINRGNTMFRHNRNGHTGTCPQHGRQFSFFEKSFCHKITPYGGQCLHKSPCLVPRRRGQEPQSGARVCMPTVGASAIRCRGRTAGRY